LTALGLSLAGCSTPGQPAKRNARFHEASHVDAVLQFSSWEYTFMVKPRYDEEGFLRQVHCETIGQLFDSYHVGRDMAVVVMGWTYAPEDMNRLVAEWKTILRGCGFRRVVFLRSNAYNKLNGSLIIDDSNLSLASAQAAALSRPASP
jgi:hypothetical protein